MLVTLMSCTTCSPLTDDESASASASGILTYDDDPVSKFNDSRTDLKQWEPLSNEVNECFMNSYDVILSFFGSGGGEVRADNA
jgi:hypothetical protein